MIQLQTISTNSKVLTGSKLFNVYFKATEQQEEVQKIFLAESFGDAESMAKAIYPHLTVDRIGVHA